VIIPEESREEFFISSDIGDDHFRGKSISHNGFPLIKGKSVPIFKKVKLK